MRPLGGKLRGAAEALIIPAGALAVSLILFGIFVAFAGANPLAVYRTIYRGAFGSWFSWQNTLQRAAPLMLTALCTALPAQVGLIVIGGDGRRASRRAPARGRGGHAAGGYGRGWPLDRPRRRPAPLPRRQRDDQQPPPQLHRDRPH